MERSQLEYLNRDLHAAGFSEKSIASHLSDEALGLVKQGSLTAARVQLCAHEQTPLVLLIRLFVLGERLTEEELSRVFTHLQVSGALQLGIVTPTSNRDSYRAAMSLTPVDIARDSTHVSSQDSAEDHHRTVWILSDLDDHLRGQPAAPDHVMGIGGATRSLMRQVPTIHASSPVLEIGTGSGVVAIACALSGAQVTATDISERALMFARANATLNGVENVRFVHGDLCEPVKDERFDLVVANPPFVIAPQSEEAVHEYRSVGVTGDALMRRVVTDVPGVLAPGGEAIFLGNWEVSWGQDRFAPVRKWFETPELESQLTGVWIIARDSLTPVQYAHTWARDGGDLPGTDTHEEHMAQALEDFRTRRIASIALGWFRLRSRSNSQHDSARMIVHAENAAGTLGDVQERSFGDQMHAIMSLGLRVNSLSDSELLNSKTIRHQLVRELREYEPGSEDPSKIWVTTSAPIARTISVDTATAAVIGASDGDMSLAELSGGLAQIFGGIADDYANALVPIVRQIAWYGVFESVEFASDQ